MLIQDVTFCRQQNIILLSALFHDSLTTVGVITVLLIGFQVFSRVCYCGRLGMLGSWDLGILESESESAHSEEQPTGSR